MVDRQDIDALLIGSLYGELSSADEARLSAHLESHPADRAALERLTHARQAVRESRILQVQLEPPQSVSAMLLQEAARRVPRHSHDETREGWFVRLRRSLMHPAMAAAAMLVVVVGVAGTMYLRKGDHVSRPEVASDRADELRPMAGSSSAAAPSPAPVNAASDEAALQKQQAGDAYRVGLAEGRAEGVKEEQTNRPEAKPAIIVTADPTPAKPAEPATSDGAANRPTGPARGLEVTIPNRAPTPKDLDADAKLTLDQTGQAPDKAPPTVSPTMPQAEPPPQPRTVARPPKTGESVPEKLRDAPRGNATPTDTKPGKGFRTPDATPPPPPPAPALAGQRRDDPAKRSVNESVSGLVTTGTGSGPGGGAAQATQPPQEDKLRAPEATLVWAREQHARLVVQVRAGKCPDAAGIALSLSTRAPTYYQQNVELDRAVKDCLPYINMAREREAERTQRGRAPAPAAAPRAKPPASSR